MVSLWEALPTEAIHPEAEQLDRRPPREILALLAREDRLLVEAVGAEGPRIEKAASMLERALSRGGRVFFAGAGTSGRLGVLEAAECPPTFGTDPDRIIALVAGGRDAVFQAVEGAEDREAEGRRILASRRLGSKDLVIGISASSVTPFVRGALAFARSRRASTVLVTCAAPRSGAAGKIADVVIAPRVGAEVLAGSTRMKAGTATKLVLNRLTLLSMIRAKKVFGPFMVDVRPGSAKLRDRALRMVAALGSIDRVEASKLLKRAGDVKTAVLMTRLGVSSDEARRRLAGSKGDLRAALETAGARGRARPLPAPVRRRARAPRTKAPLS